MHYKRLTITNYSNRYLCAEAVMTDEQKLALNALRIAADEAMRIGVSDEEMVKAVRDSRAVWPDLSEVGPTADRISPGGNIPEPKQ